MARGRRLLGQVVLVLVVMASAFVGAKLGLLGTRDVSASHNFTDVPNGAFFHDFVDFLVDTGITAGCGPLLYCPDQAVTRGQQAVFLKKFVSVGSLPQVVDATGRLVGRTTEVGVFSATVALLIQNRLVFVAVAPTGFQPSGSGLFYPAPATNCDGQGFFTSTSVGNPFAPATVSRVKAGPALFVPDLANPTVFNGAAGKAEGTLGCVDFSFTGTGYPAISLNLGALNFQTPFGLL